MEQLNNMEEHLKHLVSQLWALRQRLKVSNTRFNIPSEIINEGSKGMHRYMDFLHEDCAFFVDQNQLKTVNTVFHFTHKSTSYASRLCMFRKTHNLTGNSLITWSPHMIPVPCEKGSGQRSAWTHPPLPYLPPGSPASAPWQNTEVFFYHFAGIAGISALTAAFQPWDSKIALVTNA